MLRRRFKSLAVLILLLTFNAAVFAAKPVIDVYKDPNCGCCTEWIKNLESNGFSVNANNVTDTSVYRKKWHMPEALGSCHTATIGGYTIEGHVPAQDIQRLLKEQPKAIGLAVPGMVMGSPGMEGPHKMAYDVLLVNGDGSSSVYHHYKGD
ncbi:DUF411 domain-containing protein [Glaciimonas immobilis]|uniref:Metal-binding protein n=1 Tax=Glaciimonas immobilis TaxID=728004 RepID=A0A840RR24_9BURK|nr:DUF411 domain-containing protein [Glaciimonas immobilis]KAF3997906.1 DUF411 domain-containing protein [Glaciimonas immobilis]MBB5199438.1 hypothetical protein [Glaciimonas immobilis]